MDPRLRSALRSLLFNVIVPLAAYLATTDGAAALIGVGLAPEYAATLSAILGIVLRAFMPDAVSPRG